MMVGSDDLLEVPVKGLGARLLLQISRGYTMIYMPWAPQTNEKTHVLGHLKNPGDLPYKHPEKKSM